MKNYQSGLLLTEEGLVESVLDRTPRAAPAVPVKQEENF
jgi:hypothetical protein